jgi:hypothetical protein
MNNMNMNAANKVFFDNVRKIDSTTKPDYQRIRAFFDNLYALAIKTNMQPITNPLCIKGDRAHILKIYIFAIQEYVFHLATINSTDAGANAQFFDSNSNIEIRKTYLKRIVEFLKVLPPSDDGNAHMAAFGSVIAH